ncbi:3-deoxy-D-manno-oct-2-ulosonate III transferase WaaZ [Enterobacteriaceae bacterium BIT-l23]|uniref:3-deoxy-D-manno-oct-2-ulosonate III transferase WaaZ n=1 Tax=Jejubacter sp. L23 TaxID=3092086 RepID=UPI0015855188|nr:3-deoxy-D-manno-oct-2-ulosonate III transferase WaaZ [Enterobacteriaceae bacterium BIT-l23]
MADLKFITQDELKHIIKSKKTNDVIIFLSGPTSRNTPLEILHRNDVITVNGSASYLLDNGISPFIYTLTDARFLHQRREDFYYFSRNSRFTIVNLDVYEEASAEDQKYIRENCFILRSFYKREKGGAWKKLKLSTFSVLHRELLIKVPASRKKRLVGFSRDISLGYCSCHTIAYTAIQIAYSLKYQRIICSGLDLTGDCRRFYDESNNPMPSELSKDLFKILPFFRFMRENVKDIAIFNLSDDTAIDYKIIPYMSSEVLLGKSDEALNSNVVKLKPPLDTLAG